MLSPARSDAAACTLGETIYRGTVTNPRARDATPLFEYERRLLRHPGELSATHVTRDPRGRVVIVERARVTTAYALRRFEADNRQLGYRGTVELSADGRHLEYRLDRAGRVTTASEDVDRPVVSGPSLHGFILHHWTTLEAGRTVAVRMIVMAKTRTYGFDVRHRTTRNGLTTFSVTPTCWLLRLAVAPLAVTFETATRKLVRYEGRVPPMRQDGSRFKALDARVDYRMLAAAYG